jgi:hypothetical protein
MVLYKHINTSGTGSGANRGVNNRRRENFLDLVGFGTIIPASYIRGLQAEK